MVTLGLDRLVAVVTFKPVGRDTSEGLSLSSLTSLKLIEKRESQLWTTDGVVTPLLTAGILFFLHSISSSSHQLSQAMWGLAAIVFMLGFYAVYPRAVEIWTHHELESAAHHGFPCFG